MAIAMETTVSFDYTNHRGVKGRRTVIPMTLSWGSNEWHKEPQYLLHAWDMDKAGERTFAMKDISNWTPYTPAPAVRTLTPEEYEAKVKKGKKITFSKGGKY